MGLVAAPPLGMAVLLFRQRGARLYEDTTKLAYLFLYHAYEDEFYFWEAVKLVYLLALVCVRMLGRALEPKVRLTIFLIVLLAFTFALLWARPYRFPTVARLELGGLLITLLSTFLLQISLMDDGWLDSGSTAYGAVFTTMGVVMALYGLLLLATMLYNFAVLQRRPLGQVLTSLKHRASSMSRVSSERLSHLRRRYRAGLRQ